MDTTSAALWDAQFSDDEYLYGREPNSFFREQLGLLKPGRLVLPAEGEGRNAVFAAKNGWDVLGFDVSTVGRDKALALADEIGVRIDYRLADFGAPDLEPGSFDAAALLYAHVPEPLRAPGLRAVRDSLAPGGTLIIEAFSPKNPGLGNSFGPSLEMCYDADELRQIFSGFEMPTLVEECIPLDSGRHQGSGIVIRMVARKPE